MVAESSDMEPIRKEAHACDLGRSYLELEKKYYQLEQRNKQIIAELEEKNRQIAAELDGVLTSRAWKVASVLRRLAGFLRRR